MDFSSIKKNFIDVLNFPRAFSNRLKTYDVSDLNEYLKEHPEFENAKNLIRCICLDLELPKCETCGKIIPYSRRKNRFCSIKCAHTNPEIKRKIMGTYDKNYRQNPEKMKTLVEKIRNTQIERYGGYGFQSEILREKVHQKVKEKYGVDNVFQNEEIKKKIRQTNIAKYGVEYPTQSKEIRNKAIKTNNEKYGVDYPLQCEAGKQIFKNAMQKKYGVDWARQSPEIQKKIQENSYERHGFSSPRIADAWNTIERFSDRVIPLFSKEDFKGLGYTYRWKCVKCGNEFEALLGQSTFIDSEFERLPRCMNCHPYLHGTSQKELALLKFCQDFFPSAKKANRNALIDNLSLDIVIPEIHLALEFNGNFWHSIEGWDGSLDRYYGRHLHKTKLCNEKGYRLIHIWEDEWTKSHEDLKSQLEKVFLGTEDLSFSGEEEVILDRSWYNNMSIPGYEVLEEIAPKLVLRDGYYVEDCGWLKLRKLHHQMIS